MKRAPLLFASSLMAAAFPSGAWSAESAAPAAETERVPPLSDSVVAAPPERLPVAGDPPARSRTVSPEMASKLALGAPKYSPPNPDANATPPPDLREIDRPKNGIVRLPDYVVREEKPPDFKQRELLTLAGKIQLAYKRHPGLKVGSLPFLSNNGVGLAMMNEEERLERLSEMNDLLSLTKFGDGGVPRELKDVANDTYVRSR